MLHQFIRTIVLLGAISHFLSSWPGIQAAELGTATYGLKEILQLVLERNPAVAGAEGVIEQHRGQRIEAGAYPNPTILGQTGAAKTRDPSTGRTLTEFVVTLHQPLEWPGKRAARKKAAEAGLAGATAGMAEARLNLTAEAKLAFYALLLAQEGAEIAKQNLGAVEEVGRVVKIRVRSGEAARLESIKADVEVLKANQELTRARNAVRVGRVRLDTLTAGALGRAFTIRGDFRSFQPGLELENSITRAVEQHPTLRRLQSLVERADLTVVEEQQSRVPDVTVFGGFAREIGREAVVAGVSVPTPLWYRRQGEITAALGAKRKNEAELFLARNELVEAVYQHFQDAETAAEQIEVFEKGLQKQAQEALRIAQLSFRHGAASLLEVLDAQRVSRQVQLEYAQARLDLSIALTRLERSVGGVL